MANDKGWILVIQPGERALFELLRERLAGERVTVVMDRRQHERRRGSTGQGVDRRAVERRRRRPIAWLMPAGDREHGEPGGPPDPAGTVQRAPAAVVRACPSCATEVELDLPRFPQPPARLDLTVGHVAAAAGTGGRGAQHFVDIAAFTVTGRLLLSQRAPARRRR